MYIKCQKCGKRLKDPVSQRRGYGPECWDSITGTSENVSSSYRLPDDYEVPGQMSLSDYVSEEKKQNE